MAHENGHIGWIEYSTETEANDLIGRINTCLGLPTPDGKTITWALPVCYQNDYEGIETESGWFVIIHHEVYDCLTQAEKDVIITTLPYDISCGTPQPITGNTENIL